MSHETEFMITGATGFAGSHHVDQLVKDGRRVVATVRDKANIPNLAESVGKPNLTIVELDLKNITDVRDAFALYRPRYLIHLAGDPITAHYKTDEDLQKEYVEHSRMLVGLVGGIIRESPQTVTMLTASSLEYLMLDENDRPKWLTNKDATGLVLNGYASVKAIETMIGGLLVEDGRDVRNAMVFNHSGARRTNRTFDGKLYETAVRAKADKATWLVVVGNLDMTRDWQHVSNWVDATVAISENGRSGNGYDVCSGQAYTTIDLITAIAASLDLNYDVVEDPSKTPTDQPLKMYGDNDALRSIGWTPQKTFAQMIEDGIAWHKSLAK